MDSSSFDEIFRRFQSVTGTSTQQELADVLGIKQSTISESKKRGTVPPGWFLVLFEMRGVNPDWLKQGKGPIYLRTEDGRYMEPEPAATPLGRGVSLPYYDSDRVQDGVWEPSGTIMLPEPYAGKELRILRITGDSFSPTVRQGAFVGVDTSSVRPSSGSIFMGDKGPLSSSRTSSVSAFLRASRRNRLLKPISSSFPSIDAPMTSLALPRGVVQDTWICPSWNRQTKGDFSRSLITREARSTASISDRVPTLIVVVEPWGIALR